MDLKALVDKENNRVIFVESNEDFIDILFSFFTMPMGTIIRLIHARTKPPAVEVGSMSNIYRSVEKLDVCRLRTEACKTMLLHPKNAAAAQCNGLKLNIDDGDRLRYFCCGRPPCTAKLLSHYPYAICGCGETTRYELYLSRTESKVFDARGKGVFLKGLTRLIISDELQVMPSSTETSFSVLSKHGIMDPSAIEEKTFNVGLNEVLNLLKCSLVSKTPLTEVLLNHVPVLPELSKEDFKQGCFIKPKEEEEEASNGDTKIRVKLIVSKSKKMVCYAEAGEDFIDLLFSFLTVPLGNVLKEIGSGSLKGCINHSYNSVQDLDTEQYFKSDDHKAMLVNPKLSPGFGYENQPLRIEEDKHQPYYYVHWKDRYLCLGETLTSDRALIPSEHSKEVSVLNVMDPKRHYKVAASGGGFVIGPAMFTVTDNLIITPISPISGLSVLNKLMVPLSDVETRVVQVGNEEALRLLVASFISESALTNVFILKEPKQE